MQSKPSRWRSDPYEVEAGRALARGLGVSPVVGAILARRGFGELDEARRFLAAGESHDPRTLPGVPDACELILRHVERGSTSPCSATTTSTASAPRRCCPHAPCARCGPGLGAAQPLRRGLWPLGGAVARLAGRGVALLVTVDYGITAVEPVAAARAAGLDVVVTDHHRPGGGCPTAASSIPALGDYGCPELCASGVVLKLSEALHAAAGRDPAEAPRTSTSPRSPRSATSFRCAARTAASCARAWSRWGGRGSPACGR